MYLSIHLLKNIWSDSTFLVPVGKAAVRVCVCVYTSICISLGHLTGSGIAGPTTALC